MPTLSPSSPPSYSMSPLAGPKCRICDRPLSLPWRVFDATGRVTMGCIADDHSGFLLTPENSRWHNRAEAKKWRADERKRLTALLS